MYTQIALIPKNTEAVKYIVRIMPEDIKNGFYEWINEFDSDAPEKQIGIDCPDIIPIDIIKEFKIAFLKCKNQVASYGGHRPP